MIHKYANHMVKSMNEILEKISKIGIVPVIALENAEDAAPLAKALCDGGLPCAEVTFRTAAAEASIRIIATQFPDMLVGAGTVLTTDQVDRAMEAGAKFIVSPGLNPKIVKYCIDKNIIVLPGCTNPSDIEQAIELGLTAVKFFPAEASGGLNMIKAMAAPYTMMKFMPTGGISPANLNTYLDFPKIIACGGSWMVSNDLIKSKNFSEITALTKQAVASMLGFKLAHVGINMNTESEAGALADTFEQLFDFKKDEKTSSIFSGAGLEIMKTPYLGAKGHIAIATNYIERAIYHLEMRGFQVDKDTEKYDGAKLKAVYLVGNYGDFALHLVQR